MLRLRIKRRYLNLKRLKRLLIIFIRGLRRLIKILRRDSFYRDRLVRGRIKLFYSCLMSYNNFIKNSYWIICLINR